jgi:hypothetical protein
MFDSPSEYSLTGFFFDLTDFFNLTASFVVGELAVAQEVIRQIQILDFDRKVRTAGQVKVALFTSAERAMRAAKFFFIFLGLGLFAVLIPVLHFVLVPLFSFAAVGSAVAMTMQKEQVRGCSGECPYCGKATGLKRAAGNGEFRDACEHCLQLVYVTVI